MSDQNFFEESRDQSIVKATIVSKYFWAWAKVIIPTAKAHGGNIAYLDLFAGPGRYQDGTKSTPLLILQQAIADPDMIAQSCLDHEVGLLPGDREFGLSLGGPD